MRYCFSVIFAVLFLSELPVVRSQNYRTALGLRLGAPHCISLKRFTGNADAIEVFAGYRYRGRKDSWFNLGGLYEHHSPIAGAPGLRWYVGGGAAVLFWNYVDNWPLAGYARTTVSLLGALGLDFKLSNAPINLSADWVPIVFLGYMGPYFGGGYGAIGVRYTFN